MSGEPWWVRHEKLKAIHGPKAKEDYKRKTRRIDERCFNLPTDPKLCPHLRWRRVGGEWVVSGSTCRIVRCPRDDIEEGER